MWMASVLDGVGLQGAGRNWGHHLWAQRACPSISPKAWCSISPVPKLRLLLKTRQALLIISPLPVWGSLCLCYLNPVLRSVYFFFPDALESYSACCSEFINEWCLDHVNVTTVSHEPGATWKLYCLPWLPWGLPALWAKWLSPICGMISCVFYGGTRSLCIRVVLKKRKPNGPFPFQ